MNDDLQNLVDAIAAGLNTNSDTMTQAMKGIFGTRYHKRSAASLDEAKPPFFRNAYSKSGAETEHIAYAGFINPDNPPSGPYGGTSLVWFPTADGCIIDFGIGTRGLNPDEGILTRAGHRRRISSLRSFITKKGIKAWARQDPSTIGVPVPDFIVQDFPAWKPVFDRYSKELYCLAQVPKDNPKKAREVVQAFLDLYAHERRWDVLKSSEESSNTFIDTLHGDWLLTPTQAEIYRLLKERRFVILEGPPGTGKSRMAKKILKEQFKDNGIVTQFHPSTTYEDFVAGLSPDISNKDLRFQANAGHLLQAAKLANNGPTLLLIDEINRADLGRVLGEAIYLFEPGKAEEGRTVQLPHKIDDKSTISLPKDLFVIATMNTADKSVSKIDLAIRRRFAFVRMMPEREAVKSLSTEKGLKIFDILTRVFLEWASDESLSLLPGQSYFIAKSDADLRDRVKYDLIPLIDEYLKEGYLGSAAGELFSARNSILDEISETTHAK